MTFADLINLIAGSGPTAFNGAMRQNLGLNIPQGGPRQTSGMAGGVPSFTGYTPVPVRPDPVQPMLPVHPALTPKPKTPVVKPKAPVIPGFPVQPKVPTANPNTALQRGSNWNWLGGANAR